MPYNTENIKENNQANISMFFRNKQEIMDERIKGCGNLFFKTPYRLNIKGLTSVH